MNTKDMNKQDILDKISRVEEELQEVKELLGALESAKSVSNIKVGQIYRDIEDASQSLYIVALVHSQTSIDAFYTLISLELGSSYADMHENIEDIFGDDRNDFVLEKSAVVLQSGQ
ncbi:hypothetical protein N9955_00470 [bacterium]|nr:hypothetical protein [bacterium]